MTSPATEDADGGRRRDPRPAGRPRRREQRVTQQTGTVTWWGHASVEIRLDGARLVTDPLLRNRVGPLHSLGYRPSRRDVASLTSVDGVLLSHLHHDHTDLPSIRRFAATTTTVVPTGAGPLLRRHARGPVLELPTGSSVELGGVRVEVTPARHDGTRLRHRAEAVGFLVRGSRTVYFAGDTEEFPEMAAVAAVPGGLDLAILPVSGWGLTLGTGHMDALAAARAVTVLRPRVALPVHWGTLRIPLAWRLRRQHLLTAAVRFAALVAQLAPATQVVVPVPGVPIPLAARSEHPT
jgi:L-ascorbate metabolism protein UlaG (beta-lactamase superfamily)